MVRVSKTSSFALIAVLALGACEFQTPEFLAPAAPGTPTTQIVERDIEAPGVFQITETGLWDGRPSLGGVWVAHPTVGDPERVIIRNPANNKFVVGALFRKETQLPGPDLQVSSDAAGALGLIAGQPQVLNVTALRRQDVPESAPAAAAPAAPATDITTATGAGAATSAASNVPAPLGIDTTALPASGSAPATPAPAISASADLERPYIQVGIFSQQSNANEVAGRLSAAGVPTSVSRLETGGKTFWRVIAGPANSTAGRDDLLTKVQAQGFSDAYAVKN
ncbi:MAG: SPOR domain-containing protein [Pseudomonadota bacterium]